MTSQEIAHICGVSKTTVSRVINNDPNVKAETRERVLAAMKEHNYVPIASARRLAGVESNIIGLFVMEINTTGSNTRVSKSSYFSKLVSLIVDQANNIGYHILVSIVTSEEQLEEAKKLYLGGTISSGIFIGVNNQSTRLDELAEIGLPMVIIDRQVHNAGTKKGQMVINLDNLDGGYMATNYLIEKGHRCIAHIAGDMNKLSAIDRLNGYKNALKNAGILYDEKYVYESGFSEDKCYDIVLNSLDISEITAIFAANDETALATIQALQEKGLKVPDDISVIGFDNAYISSYITPRLTTVNAPFEEIAKASIQSLIYYYKHGEFTNLELIIHTTLVERESVTEK